MVNNILRRRTMSSSFIATTQTDNKLTKVLNNAIKIYLAPKKLTLCDASVSEPL